MKRRDYAKEYRDFHGKPEQVAARSSRNKARRMMEADGMVHRGDGLDVDHRDSNPKNNKRSNLRVQTKSKNRSRNGH